MPARPKTQGHRVCLPLKDELVSLETSLCLEIELTVLYFVDIPGHQFL